MKAFVAIVTTLLAGLSLPAHAEDKKFYPATLCQGSVGENYSYTAFDSRGDNSLITGYYVQPASYSFSGAVYNPVQNTEMQLVCPIVRDVQRADNLGWNTLIVDALNLSHSRNLTCNAQTFYENDYSYGSISSATLGPNTDWTNLSFSTMALPSTGYILVYCSIPRVDSGSYPSGLASYWIDE